MPLLQIVEQKALISLLLARLARADDDQRNQENQWLAPVSL